MAATPPDRPVDTPAGIHGQSSAADSSRSGSTLVRVIILGDSITAGFGVDPDEAFPARLQARIDSLGYNARIVDAGISGDTSTGGLNRIDWVLEDGVDVLIIELGGNDGLRGVDPDVTRQSLSEIIERTKNKHPEAAIILAGMMVPPNLGHEYTQEFRQIYPALARKHGTDLIPFILEQVGGREAMMQADGIHPNEAGHRRVAENVWKVLHPILRSQLKDTSS